MILKGEAKLFKPVATLTKVVKYSVMAAFYVKCNPLSRKYSSV